MFEFIIKHSGFLEDNILIKNIDSLGSMVWWFLSALPDKIFVERRLSLRFSEFNC